MSIDKQPQSVKIICAIFYCFPDEISIQLVGASSAIGTFQPAKAWKKIYNTPASIDYKEKQIDGSAGTIYDKELQLYFPGNDQASQDELTGISRRPILIKFDYQDGVSKVVGLKENPAMLSLDLESSAKTGFIASFRQISQYRSMFYYPDLASIPA